MKETLATVEQRVQSLAFSQADEAKAEAKVLELLDAKVVVRGTKRTDSGSPIYEERPDNAVQLSAAKLILEYRKGKPSQSIDLNATPPGSRSQVATAPLELMRRNPALAAHVLETYLDLVKTAQAIDVTPTSASSAPRPPE